MPLNPLLILRKEELSRRVTALPAEVKLWQERSRTQLDLNLHYSQLQAISVLISAYEAQQTGLLQQLDCNADATFFKNTAFEIAKSIVQSQRTWDFFRDKLELRFSPEFKDIIWIADTVAWDCYRPVLEQAAGEGIISHYELREPPLTYLCSEFSPATWVRGSRPNDGRDYHLGKALLPIPVIELPWDHVQNVWEFLTIMHEVGHDLDFDLRLNESLVTSVVTELSKTGVSYERISIWMNWVGELFADLVGLQLGGPAFAETMLHLLLLPDAMVVAYDPKDPHPTHYIRALLNARYIPSLIPSCPTLLDHANRIETTWRTMYGNLPDVDAYLDEFPVVYRALMDTPFDVLKGNTVRMLIPYTLADDVRIRNATGYLLTGMNKPAHLRPRHCISSARLAITQAAQSNMLSTTLITSISERTRELVRTNAPYGLLAPGDAEPHKQFIRSFVGKF